MTNHLESLEKRPGRLSDGSYLASTKWLNVFIHCIYQDDVPHSLICLLKSLLWVSLCLGFPLVLSLGWLPADLFSDFKMREDAAWFIRAPSSHSGDSVSLAVCLVHGPNHRPSPSSDFFTEKILLCWTLPLWLWANITRNLVLSKFRTFWCSPRGNRLWRQPAGYAWLPNTTVGVYWCSWKL